MRIIFLPEVLEYFNELATILYEKEYFGFEESALQYVDDLLTDIKTTLSSKQKKTAPLYFERYGVGMSYITIRKNKNTQWYVFFVTYKYNNEIVCLIRHISNNHIAAQFL
jgi:hypothetical protein